MEYAINRAKRNSIILCSSFLILYVLITRLLFLFNTPTKIETIDILIRNVIYLIPFGFLMLVFFNYFRYYKLKVLQISVLTIFITEVLLKSTLFTNIFESTLEKALFSTTGAIWVIATIILLVFLFQNKMKNYPGIIFVRMYAISIILIYVLATTIPFYVQRDNILTTQQLVGLTAVIPYVFTINFAIKIYSKE